MLKIITGGKMFGLKSRALRLSLGAAITFTLLAGALPAQASSEFQPTATEGTKNQESGNSVSGSDALTEGLAGFTDGSPELHERLGSLIKDSAPVESGISSNEDGMTLFPDEGSSEFEMMSFAEGEAVSFEIEGSEATSLEGDAAVLETEYDDAAYMAHSTTDGGLQIAKILHSDEAEPSIAINSEVPEGYSWVLQDDGSLHLAGEPAGVKETLMVMDAPWAVDANGIKLPTSFNLDGTRIVQTIDTAGATFPVVADPSAWWWARSTATCIAQVGLLFAPGAAAAKVAKAMTKAQSIINKSAKLKKAVNALGGLKPALSKVVQFVKNKNKLTASQRANVLRMINFGVTMLDDALGIGSCVSIIKEIAKK
ncbi:hypothetical protein [Paeniglutamicibacter terrestris]|uniref:Uncharacterized protein n=1 Tax=Paeniglutamicibacter terrestris TaxID=2723403 RepID=A0ABX1G6D2_9MICC|nr:hypothetical protein [Paeniglutamicibacter terrestris]NKG21831.1 hypothetical protein [Paeniglutamicibacter terrestris]